MSPGGRCGAAIFICAGLACSGSTTAAPTAAPEPAEPEAALPPAPDAAPPPVAEAQEPDLAGEIAWAWETYPGLREVRRDSLVPKLVAWLEPGEETEAFLATEDDCQPVLLQREEDEHGDARLVALMNVKATKIEGERARTWDNYAELGRHLRTIRAGQTEVWRNGAWEVLKGYGTGGSASYLGSLSQVDDEVAVFAGVPVRASLTCAGPEEMLACDGGGQRMCDSCRQARVELRDVSPGYPRRRAKTVRVNFKGRTCSEPCPELTPADADRLSALFSRIYAWKLVDDPATAPALYRSRDRCQRERSAAAKP